jgi:hypothetical protein
MKYKNFDEWFNERENFGTRAERFYEEMQHMTNEHAAHSPCAIEWLKAAWECARMDDVRDRFESECG